MEARNLVWMELEMDVENRDQEVIKATSTITTGSRQMASDVGEKMFGQRKVA